MVASCPSTAMPMHQIHISHKEHDHNQNVMWIAHLTISTQCSQAECLVDQGCTRAIGIPADAMTDLRADCAGSCSHGRGLAGL